MWNMYAAYVVYATALPYFLRIQYNTKESGIVELNVDVSLVYGGVVPHVQPYTCTHVQLCTNTIFYF